MKLKHFLDTCNFNTLEIEILDGINQVVFDGPLYLAYHLPNEEIIDTAIWKNYNLKPEDILNSEVEAWELDNDQKIRFFTDLE